MPEEMKINWVVFRRNRCDLGIFYELRKDSITYSMLITAQFLFRNEVTCSFVTRLGAKDRPSASVELEQRMPSDCENNNSTVILFLMFEKVLYTSLELFTNIL